MSASDETSGTPAPGSHPRIDGADELDRHRRRVLWALPTGLVPDRQPRTATTSTS